MNKSYVLDLETYFKDVPRDKDKYTLRHSNIVDYVKDSRWKIITMAVRYPNGRCDCIPESRITSLLSNIDKDDWIIAHNWAFDGFALRYHYGFEHFNVFDTLLAANAVFGPKSNSGIGNDLGTLADRMGLPHKKSLDFMNGVKNPTLEQLEALKDYAVRDIEITYQLARKLYTKLSRKDFEIWLMQHTLNMFINRPFSVSQEKVQLAEQAINKIKEEVLKKIVDKNLCLPEELTKKVFEERLQSVLEKNNLEMPYKESATTGNKIPALAKTDFGFQQLLNSPNEDIRDLAAARLIVKSEKIAISRLNRLKNKDKLHLLLQYCGTITGRWSGAGVGFNPQNIPNPLRASNGFERLVGRTIRECIKPEEGKVFINIDLAQIEARVLAFVSGQYELVEAFRNKKDIYSMFASRLSGIEVRKPSEGDDEQTARRLYALRSVGKEAILGLGYGMGAHKFLTRLKSNPLAEDIRQAIGSDIDLKLAKQIVQTYRKTYPKITKFWENLSLGVDHARRGTVAKIGNTGISFYSGARINEEHDSIIIELPSTRKIRYYKVREHPSANKHTKETNYEITHSNGRKLYGGLLAENVVSAISRDILAEDLYKCEQNGYPVYLTIHDSVILSVDKNNSEKTLELLLDIFRECPKWIQGIPLDAEGVIGEDFNL